MSKVTEKETKYYIVLKSEKDFFKIETILIKRKDGDIFYIPSQLKIMESNFGFIGMIMDKITLHRSGRFHIKLQNGQYCAKEQRAAIENMGYQEVIRDTIIDFNTLPKFKKTIDELDVVFDIKNYSGSIQFIFYIVSGRLIVARHEGKQVPIKLMTQEKKKEIMLAGQIRCLGHESKNADKLLEYALFKYIGNEKLPTGRRVFLSGDSKILRDI